MNARSNLILIGPMGVGKTTHGKWLARQLGKAFVDLDADIENRTGASIADIFELEGEAGFRRRESEALARVLSEDGQVIATGGGAVLNEDNRTLMRQRGLVVHLHIPPEQQLQRLANDRKRPLLQSEDRAGRLQQLYEVRTPLYRGCANLSLDLSRMPMSRIRPHLLQAITEFRNTMEPPHA
ncbi:shikimate kinase [Arenimonas sp.]|jgi:shikimate kinase|uniref:shikimate kinase n=1 Tax=Arenimonas sp. TaxID=1872635 RepID=UPI0037C02A28